MTKPYYDGIRVTTLHWGLQVGAMKMIKGLSLHKSQVLGHQSIYEATMEGFNHPKKSKDSLTDSLN